MPPQLAFLALIGPVALLLSAATARGQPGLRPKWALAASTMGAAVATATAIGCAGAVAIWGPRTSPLLGVGGIGLSVRLDALSVIMVALVSFVGLIVIRFSRNYLDGDPRQGRFLGRLSLTLAAVSLLVVSGNIVQLTVAWVATSLALHGLLVFYPDRPRARIAARKKFITARLGDVCLVGAMALLAYAFGSTDIATILEAARAAHGPANAAIAGAAVLIAVAALLKSAQFPTQGWLIEVMETPTPVSALLHAGIVNAGGFLVVRFADVMLMHAPALHLLAMVGAITALVATVVATTQTSIKVALAWSTAAQMGFMLMQCGFGAFALAVLHIVAHSAYKAHAFLSSGSVIGDASRATVTVPTAATRRPWTAALVAGLVAAVVVLASLGNVLNATLVLAVVFALGLANLVTPPRVATERTAALVMAAALTAGLIGFYLALHAGAVAVLGPSLPSRAVDGSFGTAVAIVAIAGFSAVGLSHLFGVPRFARRAAGTAYVHLANGLYTNALFNRLIGAHQTAASRT